MRRLRKKDGGGSGGEDKMYLDPAWIPVISAFVGVATGFAGGMIKDSFSYKRDKEKRIQEEKQRWLQSRKIAYYKFIEVFSTHAVSDDILSYFQASLNVAEYGDVILPAPLKARPYSIAFEINSLDSLLAALIFMKSTHVAVDSGPALDTYTKDLEGLRSEALTPFLNEFMNRLRQSECHPADKAKEIKKKG
jgi:hypothetical protein